MTLEQAREVAGSIFDIRKRVENCGWCDPSECGWCARNGLCDALAKAEGEALKVVLKKEKGDGK